MRKDLALDTGRNAMALANQCATAARISSRQLCEIKPSLELKPLKFLRTAVNKLRELHTKIRDRKTERLRLSSTDVVAIGSDAASMSYKALASQHHVSRRSVGRAITSSAYTQMMTQELIMGDVLK